MSGYVIAGLFLLVLLVGLRAGALLAHLRPLMNLLVVFIVAWAFVIVSFIPGFEVSALTMRGEATGEHCSYAFGQMPNPPVLPQVAAIQPCPPGDVCFARYTFMQLLHGIGALEGDNADLRRRWTLETQAYGQECGRSRSSRRRPWPSCSRGRGVSLTPFPTMRPTLTRAITEWTRTEEDML